MTFANYVIGNWKMYKTSCEARAFIEQVTPLLDDFEGKVYLSVPYTLIHELSELSRQTKIVIGAQNMNDASEGAFTGEIAGKMLKDAGAYFVLLGHSERRKLFLETSDFIHKKVLRAFKTDIQPVLCVGETIEEKDSGMMKEVIHEQISSALQGISLEDAAKVILAYEPVWAIGTGRAADIQSINEAHDFCRECLKNLFGEEVSKRIPILYGGSVNLENVSSIIQLMNVDGILVGGASLDARTFASIAVKCKKVSHS